MKHAKSFIGEKLKISKIDLGDGFWAITDMSGRNIIADYKTKIEAKAAFEMLKWIVKVKNLEKKN